MVVIPESDIGVVRPREREREKEMDGLYNGLSDSPKMQRFWWIEGARKKEKMNNLRMGFSDLDFIFFGRSD